MARMTISKRCHVGLLQGPQHTHTQSHTHTLITHSRMTVFLYVLPSGNLTYLWKDPPCLMEKSTISMAIFNNVSL